MDITKLLSCNARGIRNTSIKMLPQFEPASLQHGYATIGQHGYATIGPHAKHRVDVSASSSNELASVPLLKAATNIPCKHSLNYMDVMHGICQKVTDTGLYNYTLAKNSLPTNLKIKLLEYMAEGYHATFLVRHMKYGFPVS